MTSSLENDLMDACMMEFRGRLHAVVPLRHPSEHNDEASIRSAAEREARRACVRLMKNIEETSEISLARAGSLTDVFLQKIQQLVNEYVFENQESKLESDFFLHQQVDRICQDLRVALETKMLINQDMDLHSVEYVCGKEILSALSYFEIWKHGNLASYEEQKTCLENKLSKLKQELLEKRKHDWTTRTTDEGARHALEEMENTGINPNAMGLSNALENDQPTAFQEGKVEIMNNVLPAAESNSIPSLQESDEAGYVPFLRAIERGQGLQSIEILLDEGGNANARTEDEFGLTAVHVVINALIKKNMKSAAALAILELLIKRGFNLINEKTTNGCTALFLAMEYQNLDEELISWFHLKGADFNFAEKESGNSVLFHAVFCEQCARIIRKLIECGANVNHVNKSGDSLLHLCSNMAHDPALEIFIDTLDVNQTNKENMTPLNMLFAQKDLDYTRCLLILMKNGADFKGRCTSTLHQWIIHGTVNPFPSLVKAKDVLVLNDEIASETLTFLIWHTRTLQKFLCGFSRREHDDCAKFMMYIIENKRGRLLCPGNINFREQIRCDLDRYILTDEFCLKLKSTRLSPWKGKITSLNSANVSKMEFQTESGAVTYPTEVVLSVQLACKNYKQFVKLGLAIAEGILRL